MPARGPSTPAAAGRWPGWCPRPAGGCPGRPRPARQGRPARPSRCWRWACPDRAAAARRPVPARTRRPAGPAMRTRRGAATRGARPGRRPRGRSASGVASGQGRCPRHCPKAPVTESAAPLKAPDTAAAAPATWSPPGMRAAGHLAECVAGYACRSEPAVTARRHQLGGLDGEHGVRAVAAGRHEQVVEVLDSRLRVERHDRVLELLGADDLGQVARHQQERVTDRDLAPPDLDPQGVVRGQARLLACVVGHQQPRGAHEVCLGAADGRDVQLVVADDRDGDAEGARWQAAALAAAAQLAVGARGPPSRDRWARPPTRRSSTRAGSCPRPAAAASRARPPSRAELTTRYRLPLERTLEPVAGSVTSIASAEVDSRSASATRPYLSSRRGPMGGLVYRERARCPVIARGDFDTHALTVADHDLQLGHPAPDGGAEKASSSTLPAAAAPGRVAASAALTTSVGGWTSSTWQRRAAGGTSSATSSSHAAHRDAASSSARCPGALPRRAAGPDSRRIGPARHPTRSRRARRRPATRSRRRRAPGRGRPVRSWSRRPAAGHRCAARGGLVAAGRAREKTSSRSSSGGRPSTSVSRSSWASL